MRSEHNLYFWTGGPAVAGYQLLLFVHVADVAAVAAGIIIIIPAPPGEIIGFHYEFIVGRDVSVFWVETTRFTA